MRGLLLRRGFPKVTGVRFRRFFDGAKNFSRRRRKRSSFFVSQSQIVRTFHRSFLRAARCLWSRALLPASFVGYRTAPSSDYQSEMRRNADEVHNHSAARLSPVNLKRMEHIPPGGSWRDIPFGLLPEGMKRAKRSDHTKRYGRLKWTGLASTILTKCDPHWGAYFHPQQDRSITVREAARLQLFPVSTPETN